MAKWLETEGIEPANFYFERFAPKEKTGGDAETGAPVSSADVAESGDSISKSEAVSSMETGRLSFAKEDSFAQLDARMGLELAITELMMPKITDEQVKNLRRLADATADCVSGSEVKKPEDFVRYNEEFHEYLFTVSNNPALLESYRRLDLSDQMQATFESGTVIFDRVIQDHVDFVGAFEKKDIERAREVIMAHARDAKETMEGAIVKKESE